jgi:hypothetical protein
MLEATQVILTRKKHNHYMAPMIVLVNMHIKGVVLRDRNTPVFEPMTGSLGNHLIHQPSVGVGQ